jgi:ABC-2 type transport system permease protein
MDHTESWTAFIVRHGRLWRGCLNLALVREMQFRGHFLTTIVVGIAQVLLGLVPVLVLFRYTGAIQGWTRADMIVMLGVQQAVMGMMGMFIIRNMWEMSSSIIHGTLDQMLIRPVNAQFYTATRWIRPDQVFNIVTGLAIVLIGLAQGRGMPPVSQAVQGLALFFAGFVLLACATMAVSYMAFWLQSMFAATHFYSNEVLGAGRYPVAFFPLVVKLALTFIVPLAFATTFPAEALTHGISWWVVAGAIAFAALALAALRALWNVAIRQYASASS